MGSPGYYEVCRSPGSLFELRSLIRSDSLPYLVRFRHCVIEYCLPSNSSQRPLFNAIKYATAFPVIFLSAAQKSVPVIDRIAISGDISSQPGHATFRLW